jgi:hypothetical protein
VSAVPCDHISTKQDWWWSLPYWKDSHEHQSYWKMEKDWPQSQSKNAKIFPSLFSEEVARWGRFSVAFWKLSVRRKLGMHDNLYVSTLFSGHVWARWARQVEAGHAGPSNSQQSVCLRLWSKSRELGSFLVITFHNYSSYFLLGGSSS